MVKTASSVLKMCMAMEKAVNMAVLEGKSAFAVLLGTTLTLL